MNCFVARSRAKMPLGQVLREHPYEILPPMALTAPSHNLGHNLGATPWHRDPFHRVTVVLNGDLLEIEFRDGGETQAWEIRVGEVDWSEPSDRVHRAVNVGKGIV